MKVDYKKVCSELHFLAPVEDFFMISAARLLAQDAFMYKPPSNHPWGKMDNDGFKMAEAKAAATRKYQREFSYDEYRKVKLREGARKRLGIPIDLPVMKSWDWAKGKVVAG